MQRVISHLYDQGAAAPALRRASEQLPLVEGLGPLLAALAGRRETGTRWWKGGGLWGCSCEVFCVG